MGSVSMIEGAIVDSVVDVAEMERIQVRDALKSVALQPAFLSKLLACFRLNSNPIKCFKISFLFRQ